MGNGTHVHMHVVIASLHTCMGRQNGHFWMSDGKPASEEAPFNFKQKTACSSDRSAYLPSFPNVPSCLSFRIYQVRRQPDPPVQPDYGGGRPVRLRLPRVPWPFDKKLVQYGPPLQGKARGKESSQDAHPGALKGSQVCCSMLYYSKKKTEYDDFGMLHQLAIWSLLWHGCCFVHEINVVQYILYHLRYHRCKHAKCRWVYLCTRLRIKHHAKMRHKQSFQDYIDMR